MDIKLISLFQDNLAREIPDLLGGSALEVVVGIPFFDEKEFLPGVVETARVGLDHMGLTGKAAIVLAGPKRQEAAFAHTLASCSENDRGVPIRGLLLDQRLAGRGFSALALMATAIRAGGKLVLLLPGLEPQRDGEDIQGRGFAPHWIGRLFHAVARDKLDLALARFNQHPLTHPVESLLAYPLISGIFGYRIRHPMPGVMALSYRMMRSCLDSLKQCPLDCSMLGFDPWLTSHAIMEKLFVGEVCLGLASFKHDVGSLKLLFRQVTGTLLTTVTENQKRWLDRPFPIEQPLLLGPIPHEVPPGMKLEHDELLRHFKHEFDHFDYTLFHHLVPDETREQMEQCADGDSDNFGLTREQWNDILQRFAVAFAFPERTHPSDTVDGLFPLFLARFLSLVGYNQNTEASLEVHEDPDDLNFKAHRALTERELNLQADELINTWPAFRETWRAHQQDRGSYLPRLGAWEFIPNVDILVPQEIKKKDGTSAWAFQVYQEILKDRRSSLKRFITEDLKVGDIADAGRVLSRVQEFMVCLDEGLGNTLFPHGLDTPDGARRMTDDCIREFSTGTCFQLTPEAARHIVLKAPPQTLPVYLSASSAGKLLDAFAPNDLLAMTAWTDHQDYMDRVLDLIGREATPDWFHVTPLKSTPLNVAALETFDEVRAQGSLLRLAGRLVAASHLQPPGGEMPTLWFILKTVKRIAGIEMFSAVWQEIAEDKQNFAKQVVATIRGHWGRRILSAHNIFQNHQQRLVVEKLWRFADAKRTSPDTAEAANLLAKAAEVYHLSITLPDTTFVPLSAWTWASYGSRRGAGYPTPLSSVVERDWATRDFLLKYLESSDRGDESTLNRAIVNLMKEGRESADLGEHLLGVGADSENIVVLQTQDVEPPIAGRLVRPMGGPILEPIPEHAWESRYVLNAAAVRLDDRVYLVYRAFGEDKTSRLGLAWSRDGIHMDGRLDTPIFAPKEAYESSGCEDPRITLMGDRLYMVYTAYDGVLPQIAMASIARKDFLEKRFSRWTRHGLLFPGVSNKDAVLYPETFDGKYAVYHRIDPAMWVSYTDVLTCPWPRSGHKIVTSPRSGMMWDGIKIGAGAQPIKTTQGWLNIYHGVDYEMTYRLGVLLMDLDDPSRVLYQSPNPILEPEVDFEIGKKNDGDFWVPRVVFTCGAVLARETEIGEMDDEVYVYYGAADTAIGMAKARIGDLLPASK